ncbi:uncharacterized protein LY79DRAFT_106613 [Colletotrichum navitas]|uniref:Uncharacterized protein n=1 Tax=Colletotrichum navitas TaxID=681940 RepID=A0AAD8Q426_9PEZI|nr:uncharacterized protein LY79DRAFT_106613 [Colletotrichum navitas]KAK1595210.1 hypothetical protein LY79DRAFT_106613 [Colletotrichum navitas]
MHFCTAARFLGGLVDNMTNCATRDESTILVVGWPSVDCATSRVIAARPVCTSFDVISSTLVLCARRPSTNATGEMGNLCFCPPTNCLLAIGHSALLWPCQSHPSLNSYVRASTEDMDSARVAARMQDSCRLVGPSLSRHSHDPLASRHTCALASSVR